MLAENPPSPVAEAPRAGTSAPPPVRLSGGKPPWMRAQWFRLFSSVKLAVVLISVLVIASIAGTLYETTFDARVARAYIYNAWWFNGWLVVLCLNLTCSALSRWPWKRHHTGFLLTHLGIIILLAGAMIGRRWGIEGTIRLEEGESPDNRLEMADERVLRTTDGLDGRGEIRQFPAEIIRRQPSPGHPWDLGETAQGWRVTLVDYARAIEATFMPQMVPAGVLAANPGVAQPAVRVRLSSQRLKQSSEQWLLAADGDHASIDMGLATVQLRNGTAPVVEAAPAAPKTPAGQPGAVVDERIIAFALTPESNVDEPLANGRRSGAGVGFDLSSNPPTIRVQFQGATWNLDPVAGRGKAEDLSGSGLTATIENYWPDFVLDENHQPATASAEPRKPAVLVRIQGQPQFADAPGSAPNSVPNTGTAADNELAVYCDAAGALTFTLKSNALPTPLRGEMRMGQPLNTGWADWRVEALQVIPRAFAHTDFRPVQPGTGAASNELDDGVRVRLTKGSAAMVQWTPIGWDITVPTTPLPTRLSYGARVEPLPIGVQLEKFNVTFNEGTETPASFRSDVRVTDIDGATGRGSCSMNHPFNFPGNWWNTFSGQTYKMSQANWNPRDRHESTVQILRDPGWLLKWIGSLLVCSGIFSLFYLRSPRL